jgi:pimeloyl-ACP methyl ester carboxylesterase
VLLCPTGNARCGAEAYHAPTWQGSFRDADALLEAAVEAAPGELGQPLERRGAILMGFSRGAFHAVKIAAAHPGRWPLLLLVEADVTLHPAALRAAGVRAVALLAGERSGQLGGMRTSVRTLERAGFPARIWAMPDAGHHYSANIDALMTEALDFLVAAGAPAADAAAD